MSTDFQLLITIAAVALVLTFITRWVFKPSRPHRGRPDSSPDRDIGLLVALIERQPRAKVNQLRALLGDANIRSSASVRKDGTADVLVFRTDLDKAKQLAGL